MLGLLLVGAVTTGGLYFYRRYKKKSLKDQIKFVVNSNPPVLTKKSVLNIIDAATQEIGNKIKDILYKSRELRKNLASENDLYINSIKETNNSVEKIIKKTFLNILNDVEVTEPTLERSIKIHNCLEIKNKFYSLRKIKSENPKRLTTEEIERVLDYFIKIGNQINEMTYIELLDFDVALIQSEDKVFFKYGVEKIDVEKQANILEKTNPIIKKKFKTYRKVYNVKNIALNDNTNISFYN